MTDQNWDAGAVSDHGADAGAEHQAPGPLNADLAPKGDGGADHGNDEERGAGELRSRPSDRHAHHGARCGAQRPAHLQAPAMSAARLPRASVRAR